MFPLFLLRFRLGVKENVYLCTRYNTFNAHNYGYNDRNEEGE